MGKLGKVTLVGAGPGDVELLTLKGLRALQQADVVIFDRLVNPYILMEANQDAKVIYCGKQPCKHTLRQEDIQTEMLIHAKKGKNVVRLKGGDPAVFGRVGEEAAFLKNNGIVFEIVPGVTAGIAASMYAGVPVTHRDFSASFAVVTGHRKDKQDHLTINWGALAHSVDTLLFYMGISELETIVSKLIQYGKHKQTPVLVIQWGTYSRQKTVEGTLATIGHLILEEKVTNPAIIVIGEIVKEREQFSWFENQRYSGIGVLTPTKRETAFQLDLRQNGADIYAFPFIQDDRYAFVRQPSLSLTPLQKMSLVRLLEDGHVHLLVCESEVELATMDRCFEQISRKPFHDRHITLVASNISASNIQNFSDKWGLELYNMNERDTKSMILM